MSSLPALGVQCPSEAEDPLFRRSSRHDRVPSLLPRTHRFVFAGAFCFLFLLCLILTLSYVGKTSSVLCGVRAPSSATSGCDIFPLKTTRLQYEVGGMVEMLVGSSLAMYGSSGSRDGVDRGKEKLERLRAASIVVATAGAFEHCMCKVQHFAS